jgi:hypothetical protein
LIAKSNKYPLTSGRLLYQVFQALSLDVVLGAIIFSTAIARYYKVQLPVTALVSMSIAVWLIYTFDHLLDARKINGIPSTFRHRFHRQYQKPLIAVGLVLLVLGSVMAFYLPAIIFYTGLLGVCCTAMYFLVLQKTAFWQKEICIAVGYTWGIFVAPLSLYQGHLNVSQWLLIPQVFLVVFANLLIFSWFDVVSDKRDGHKSMVIYWGITRSEKIIQLIIGIGILLGFIIFFLNRTESTLVMQLLRLLMFCLLLLIYKKHQLFRVNDLYRVIGDGIFYIPVLFIIYAHLHYL